MVPGSFPMVYWTGEKQNHLSGGLMEKGRNINEHPLRLSLSLKPKEIRYSRVRERRREGESLAGTPRDL